MKNRLKLSLFTVSSLLWGLLFLTSCSRDDGPGSASEEVKPLVLTLSHPTIKVREGVQFTVTSGGELVGDATIYIDGTAIAGYEHIFNNPGSFKATAKKKGFPDSAPQEVSVLERKMEIVVHIVGSEKSANGTFVAKYWKNGVPVTLGEGAQAMSLAIAHGDVHVSGLASPTGPLIYWKNGLEVQRFNNAGTNAGKSITVSGEDVYLSGYHLDIQGAPVATYWKNGQTVALPDNDRGSLTNSIFVSGDAVSVAGVQMDEQGIQVVATHWKNGVAVPLKILNEFTGQYPMLAVGEDVYIAETEISEGVERAFYWKNDQKVLPVANGLTASKIKTFFISGTDVYLGGTEMVNGKKMAKYWKNGVGMSLTNGSSDAEVTSLYVYGEDVYAIGQEGNANNMQVAKYWKNGTAINLTDGGNISVANDIIVEEVEIE